MLYGITLWSHVHDPLVHGFSCLASSCRQHVAATHAQSHTFTFVSKPPFDPFRETFEVQIACPCHTDFRVKTTCFTYIFKMSSLLLPPLHILWHILVAHQFCTHTCTKQRHPDNLDKAVARSRTSTRPKDYAIVIQKIPCGNSDF